MAHNERLFNASPDQIFAVLADPYTYERWVVGARQIRHADSNWPAPGAHLFHSIGIGPIQLQDNTEVLQAEPPHRLVLNARGRPFGTARVEFRLDGLDGFDGLEGGGERTLVTMEEAVDRPVPLRLLDPFFAPVVRMRNAKTLRNLAAVVTQMTDAGDSHSPGHA